MSHFKIVGILNVTPDSYFDGGLFETALKAGDRVAEMLKEGADIIEVGGESTGPGSKDVSVEEELKRTIPVIRAIKEKYPEAVVSIDTWKAVVAKEALDAGAMIVNDVTAGRSDPDIFSVLKDSKAKLVLMYAKDTTPRTTVEDVSYSDIIKTISDFLRERKQAAIDAGIAEESLILDPGLGHFVSSDPQYSFQIIAGLERLKELGCPLLLSPSRKSFLAGSENLKTADRLPGTIAASAIAVLNGADYIRTHDVEAVRRGCEAAEAIRSAR